MRLVLPSLSAWEMLDRIAPLPDYLLAEPTAQDAPQAHTDGQQAATVGTAGEWALCSVALVLGTLAALVLGMVPR